MPSWPYQFRFAINHSPEICVGLNKSRARSWRTRKTPGVELMFRHSFAFYLFAWTDSVRLDLIVDHYDKKHLFQRRSWQYWCVVSTGMLRELILRCNHIENFWLIKYVATYRCKRYRKRLFRYPRKNYIVDIPWGYYYQIMTRSW